MKLMFLVCFYTPSPKSFNKKPSKARDVIIRYAKRWNLKHDEWLGQDICLSVRMSVGPSICLSVRTNDVCRSVRMMSVGPSVSLMVRPYDVCRSVRLYICLSPGLPVRSSVCPYFCLLQSHIDLTWSLSEGTQRFKTMQLFKNPL